MYVSEGPLIHIEQGAISTLYKYALKAHRLTYFYLNGKEGYYMWILIDNNRFITNIAASSLPFKERLRSFIMRLFKL